MRVSSRKIDVTESSVRKWKNLEEKQENSILQKARFSKEIVLIFTSGAEAFILCNRHATF